MESSRDCSVTRQKLFSATCCPAPPATVGSEGNSSCSLCGVPREKAAIVLQSSSLRPAPSPCSMCPVQFSLPCHQLSCCSRSPLLSLPHAVHAFPDCGYSGTGASSLDSVKHSRAPVWTVRKTSHPRTLRPLGLAFYLIWDAH